MAGKLQELRTRVQEILDDSKDGSLGLDWNGRLFDGYCLGESI